MITKPKYSRRHTRVSESVLEFDPMLVSRLTRTAVPGDLSDLPDGGRQILRAIRGAWINELTDRQRYYLLLYYRDLHTMQDIAEISGVTIGTVSRTLRRARNRLKRVLQYYTL